VLTVVLAVHGAVHLLGFVKWSRLATAPALSGRLLVDAGRHGHAAAGEAAPLMGPVR